MGQIAQAIKQEQTVIRTPGPACGVQRLVERLTGEDREVLHAQVSTPYGEPGALTASQLVAVLKSAGHYLSENTVQRHRRGVCRCFK